MNTKELFLRAQALCRVEQADFLLHLGSLVRTLLARYPTALLAAPGDGEIKAPASLDESTGLHTLYDEALLQGILAKVKESESDYAAFLSGAENAYRTRWREATRGKRMAVFRVW